MKRNLLFLFLLVLASAVNAQSRITAEHKQRASEIVAQMTLDEKIAYIGGYENWYIMPIDRLGLPAVRMADGPQGVRNNTKSTLYPSGIAAASTWDRDLITKMGISLGMDSRARGVHILLGPGVNIYRSPLCGRNFEYFGEDPYLSGEVAANYIKGVQSQGVMASIKHFAGNNQEYSRHNVSSDIDERTLHEIYFPAFEKAVKQADVATVMTSYNLLNSVHASESRYLNYDVLREMWGFEGLVMSDWVSCYSPLNVATWGVDIEMPNPRCMTPEILKELIANGLLDESALDRKCQHIIQTVLAYEFDKRPQLDRSIPENNPYSDSVAHQLSRSAIVMLKNEGGFLPLKKSSEFFVCGPNSDKIVTGGGSGFVTPLITSSVAEGMKTVGPRMKTTVASKGVSHSLDGMYAVEDMSVKGVAVEIYGNVSLEGKPVRTYFDEKVYMTNAAAEAHDDVVAVNLSTRHTFYYKPQSDAFYTLALHGNDGCRLFVNGEKLIDEWGSDSWQHGEVRYEFKSGVTYEFVVEHYNRGGTLGLELEFVEDPFTDPVELKKLKGADCVVVCLGHDNTTEKENFDRTFALPKGQVEYLRKVLEHNSNVVVVLNGGGGIEMASWLPDVKAVLMAWYPGQQGGLAVSEIITGVVSPSGKLPISIEARLEDNPCYGSYYENVSRVRSKTVNPYSRVEYREGVFVGYRGYERNGVAPLFPFGYGLSYTEFEYSDIEIGRRDGVFSVSFTVKNVGKCAGAEVSQVYVGDVECSVLRPAKELKGFEKVYLKPGESRRLNVCLGEEAFRFYDVNQHKFVVEPGEFDVYVGSSSADVRLSTRISVD